MRSHDCLLLDHALAPSKHATATAVAADRRWCAHAIDIDVDESDEAHCGCDEDDRPCVELSQNPINHTQYNLTSLQSIEGVANRIYTPVIISTTRIQGKKCRHSHYQTLR